MKLYGQLVGGPVQALRSGGIGIAPPHCKDSFDLILARDFVVLNGNVPGDQISLAVLRSTAFLDLANFWLLVDVLGVGVTAAIGDATFPGAIVAAMSLATAGWKRPASNTSWPPAQIAAPLWQRLGYAADPGRNIELLLTFGGAVNPANAGVAWQMRGRP